LRDLLHSTVEEVQIVAHCAQVPQSHFLTFV